MPFWTLISGAWRPVSQPSVIVGGTFRTVIAGWVVVGGTWRQFYQAVQPPPTGVSAFDTSYCDTTIAHYQLEVDFTPGNSSYGTRVEFSDTGGASWTFFGDALPGETSVTAEVSEFSSYRFRCYHIDSGGTQNGDISAETSDYTVSHLECF